MKLDSGSKMEIKDAAVAYAIKKKIYTYQVKLSGERKIPNGFPDTMRISMYLWLP